MKVPTALILVGVAAVASLLLFSNDRSEPDRGGVQVDIVREQVNTPSSPEPGGVQLQANERTAVLDGEPQEENEAVDSVVISPADGFTVDDVKSIRDNLDALWGNASRKELIEGFRNTVTTFPNDYLRSLHQSRLDEGQYQVLDLPPVKNRTSVTATSVKPSPIAYGLVRATILPDGRWAKTELELSELGGYAAQAVEIHWFELAIARRKD